MSMSAEQTGRLLALDYGLKRVGMAVSAPMNLFATPLETVDNTSEKALLTAISTVIQEYDVSAILLGLPVRTTGQEAKEAERVRAFGALLQATFSLPVVYEDERFTSTIAQQALRAQGKQPSRDKGSVDQTAAMLILQSYLDRQRFQAAREKQN
jgi:putative holliday junction resolvase